MDMTTGLTNNTTSVQKIVTDEIYYLDMAFSPDGYYLALSGLSKPSNDEDHWVACIVIYNLITDITKVIIGIQDFPVLQDLICSPTGPLAEYCLDWEYSCITALAWKHII